MCGDASRCAWWIWGPVKGVAGQVSCGLLEAFKQQKLHWDASKNRLSMTRSGPRAGPGAAVAPPSAQLVAHSLWPPRAGHKYY